MRWAVVFLLACGSKPTPLAPPAPPPSHPRESTPESDPVVEPVFAPNICMGRGLELASEGTSPVVCSYTDCGAYGEDGAPPMHTQRVEPFRLPAQTDLLAPRLCRNDGDHECRDLGKRAAAAFRKQTENGGQNLPGLRDLSAVGIGTTIWDVAADRGVPLRPPGMGLATAYELASVGNVFVAGWLPKDPSVGCTTAVVVDGHGVNHGDTFPGGHLAALDEHRFVVVPMCGHEARVIAMATGKALGAVELPAEAHGAMVQPLDAHTVALLWVLDTMEAKLAWVHVPDGASPSLGAVVTIPRCPAGVQ